MNLRKVRSCLRRRAEPNRWPVVVGDHGGGRPTKGPPFGGHSRSIPQGMIFDVQPLVKSLFCPIRQSPNGFFDFEASIS